MKKILTILILIFCTGVAFAALPASKIYEQKVGSILYIETPNATGSGIILKEDGTFVTCFHVIDNADYINVKTKDNRTYKVTGYKYLNPENDVAILTINSKNKFKPIIVNNTTKIGNIIYTIANPRGIQFVFSDGMINQLSKDKIQFSAPSSPGSSGGALLNDNGELLGMITSQYNPSNTQNINFALPASYFMPYLEKKKKNNSKNLNWAEFVASSLSEKELEKHMNYAFENKNRAMLYKYLKQIMPADEMDSDDYALYGVISYFVYLEGSESNNELLKDATKWFALSLCNNKNIEVSAYGLFWVSLIQENTDCASICYDYLKKFKKTRNLLNKQFVNLHNCDKNDDSCYEKVMNNISEHLSYLSSKIYRSYTNNYEDYSEKNN